MKPSKNKGEELQRNNGSKGTTVPKEQHPQQMGSGSQEAAITPERMANMSDMSTKESTMEKVERIIEGTEAKLGYAYLFPADGGDMQIYVFDMTPYNIANFLGAHQFDVEKIVLTTIFDTLVLDTVGGFIMTCPDQDLCRKIIKFLAPIQMGMAEAKEIDIISRDELDEYYDEVEAEEDWD